MSIPGGVCLQVTDLCVNCILFRANRDLRWLASKLGKPEIAEEIDGWLDRGFEGFKDLWDEQAGIFKCRDQITGNLCDAPISAGFLPLFAGTPTSHTHLHLAPPAPPALTPGCLDAFWVQGWLPRGRRIGWPQSWSGG